MISKINAAIETLEKESTCEVCVHISSRIFEFNSMKYAKKIFHRFGLNKTKQRNAILVYINPRKHRFAFVFDEGLFNHCTKEFIAVLSIRFKQLLQSSHPENAISAFINSLIPDLKIWYPVIQGEEDKNKNELPNIIS